MSSFSQLTSTVPRTDFEKLYSELSNALEREKQAQDILNEQSEQLKEMERRLNTVNKNSEQTDITLAEAVKVGGRRLCLKCLTKVTGSGL